VRVPLPAPDALHEAPSTRHLRAAFAAISVLTLAGVVGYTTICGMSLGDALYMTVITLSTVGFHEVQPLDGPGRLFTAGLIIAGVGTALYAAGALAEFLIAGRMLDLLGRRAMTRALASLHDHVILCGYGRLGRAVAEELERSGVPYAVIDRDAGAVASIERGVHPVFVASAADDEILARAGIERARAVVAATGSEAVNVFVALAAREANPRLHVHARAETEAGARRLVRAGASQVVSPHRLGGLRLANAILRPAVVDFAELSEPGADREFDLEELIIGPGSRLDGRRLGELSEDEGIAVAVVAIKRGEDPLALNPAREAELRAGDRVVVVGDREQLARLADLARRGPGAAGAMPGGR
jgi:voltage-gated potassium channel